MPLPPGKSYANQAFELAWYFRKTGDVLPTWFITDRTGYSEIIGTPWQNKEEKIMAGQMVADIIRERKAVRVMFIADSWIRAIPSDAPESEKLKLPSEQIDSYEAISLQLWNANSTGYFKMRAYRQNDKGELEILFENENTDWLAHDYTGGHIQVVLDALLANRY